jgi:hypothetical protein
MVEFNPSLKRYVPGSPLCYRLSAKLGGVMCQIVMLIFGIITLIRGRFLLTRAKEVRGWPARIIGILVIAPLPICFMFGLVLGAFLATMGKSFDDNDIRPSIQIVDVAIVASCFLSAIGIAIYFAEPIGKKRSEQLDAVVPDDYDERFQERQHDAFENQDIMGEAHRPSAPPDDRIQT